MQGSTPKDENSETDFNAEAESSQRDAERDKLFSLALRLCFFASVYNIFDLR